MLVSMRNVAPPSLATIVLLQGQQHAHKLRSHAIQEGLLLPAVEVPDNITIWTLRALSSALPRSLSS